MSRVLVAAEPHRIQDLVFRSSRLREVTGGSHALERFWDDAAVVATEAYEATSVPARAGGNFRALFEGEGAGERAHRFARVLSDRYHADIGGSVAVAVVGEDDAAGATAEHAGKAASGTADESERANRNDAALARRAGRELRAAKESGGAPVADVAMPFVRVCDSCARNPAEERDPHHDDGERERLLCGSCRQRGSDRDVFRKAFIERLREAGSAPPPALLGRIGDLPLDPEEVGRLDARRRVAYLVADGNGFGVAFSESLKGGFAQYEKLSRAVREAGTEALATAALDLLRHVPADRLYRVSGEEERRRREITGNRDLVLPVLPLITGGDDVFALIPASTAFWFARRFVEVFRGCVGREVSVSCALVFCKSTFPYRFAHGVGEAALRQAKTVAKVRAPGASVVRATEVRATLGDRELGPPGEYGVFTLEGGSSKLLPLDALFTARARLDKALPAVRRHAVEDLYAAAAEAEAKDAGVARWNEAAERLLARVRRFSGDAEPPLREEISALAAGAESRLCRGPLSAADAHASAMVDLLHLWDYLERYPDPGEIGATPPLRSDEVAS